MSTDIDPQASVQLSSFRFLPNLSPSQTGLALASACEWDEKKDASAERASYTNGAEAELLGGWIADSGEDMSDGNTSETDLPSAALGH